jgi:cytochrome c oxidase assembly protein subunit 11
MTETRPQTYSRRRDIAVAGACGVFVGAMVAASWRFVPEKNSIEAKLGEVITFDYIVTNQAARETLGTAAYNVAPLNYGSYFQKINCFCFSEQRMKPGETRTMTVVFYVDPAMADDPDTKIRDTITLSYTFYPQREPQRPVADRSAGWRAGNGT